MNELNKAIALINEGNFKAGLAILKPMYNKNKRDNWVTINLANCYIHLNELDSAEKLLRTVLQTEVRNDEYLIYTSKLFLSISNFKRSIESAKKAVNVNNKKPANVAQLIRACYEGRDIVTAERAINHFLKFDPDNQWALNFKALIASGRGKFEEAESLYRDMYKNDPGNVMALSGYVKTKKFNENELSFLQSIEHTQKLALDPDTQARVFLSKAKVLNDLGKFEEAWEQAEQGKNIKNRLFPFDKSAYKKYIDQIVSVFNKDSINVTSNNRSEHLLIVGMPRSGTTLVEQVLTQFKHYYPGGEVPAIDYALFRSFKGKNFLEHINELGARELSTIAGYYEDYFKNFSNYKGSQIIDKVPSNYLHIGLFKKLFPKLKVINLIRNKHDVITSMMFTEFGQMLNYTNDIKNIHFVYEQYLRLMEHWDSYYADDILSVSYDDFIINNKDYRNKISRFLSLPDIENRYQDSSNTVETPSVWQVRQGLYTDAINRWKRYPQLVEYIKSNCDNF